MGAMVFDSVHCKWKTLSGILFCFSNLDIFLDWLQREFSIRRKMLLYRSVKKFTWAKLGERRIEKRTPFLPLSLEPWN